MSLLSSSLRNTNPVVVLGNQVHLFRFATFRIPVNPKSEAPIWMAVIVICLGVIVIYPSTSRPSHRPCSHILCRVGSWVNLESFIASPHTMPFTPAHLQSFLDAESVGHSCSNRSIQIPFETRLRLTCDGRCSVDSRVYLLNEQADVWMFDDFFVILLMFFVFNLFNLPKKSHP